MFRKVSGLLLMAVVALAALTACGVGGSAGADAGTDAAAANATRVVLTEMEFEPATLTVAAGETVTLDLRNEGAMKHNLEIKGLDVSKDVDPGKSEIITFTAPGEPGKYDIICNVPGHAGAGMQGTLVVER